jgi:hypothetical protein
MNFEVGDRVVYNPNIPDLAPNTNRPRNVGTVSRVNNDYVWLRFDNDVERQILKSSISHFSQSPKGMRNAHKITFRNTLRNIPRAREGMEARRVWNDRVGLPFTGGPGRSQRNLEYSYLLHWPRTVNPNRTTSRARTARGGYRNRKSAKKVCRRRQNKTSRRRARV